MQLMTKLILNNSIVLTQFITLGIAWYSRYVYLKSKAHNLLLLIFGHLSHSYSGRQASQVKLTTKLITVVLKLTATWQKRLPYIANPLLLSFTEYFLQFVIPLEGSINNYQLRFHFLTHKQLSISLNHSNIEYLLLFYKSLQH